MINNEKQLQRSLSANIIGMFLSAAMFVPLVAAANPIDTLQPGHWYEVPNSHLRGVIPTDPFFWNPINIIEAWSGGAYDTKLDRLIVWGGGMGIILGTRSIPSISIP